MGIPPAPLTSLQKESGYGVSYCPLKGSKIDNDVVMNQIVIPAYRKEIGEE